MNKKRLRGVLSHRLFIILLLLLQIAFFGYLVLSGSQDSWLVSLFFSLVSMLVAIHVVSKHEKPGYKLTWVFTILTLPIFGGAFYLMMQLQPSVHRFRKQVESSQEALTRRLPRHEGALAGNGRTIAVFGCGVDVIYPPENAELAERILAAGGALVSEYPPGTRPLAGHFPARNRIISGLTQGTLLVEGAKGSGAMITVNFALEQGRDVFAVPGSIYSPLSATPNRMIVDGAKPVVSAWEILDCYHWAEKPRDLPTKSPTVDLDDEEKRIVLPLTEQELSFSELAELTQISPSKLNSHLTMLELRGIIVKVPGGMYRAYLDLPGNPS